MMLKFYFVNIVAQSLLQSWNIDMSGPVFRFSRMWPDYVEPESSGDSGILREWVELMEFKLYALTIGPLFLLILCVQEDCW